MAIGTLPAHGQTMSFFRQFPDSKINAGFAVVDASGIYVISNDACRADVSKYDYNGNELWTREFNSFPCMNTVRAAIDATGLYVLVSNRENRRDFVPQFLLRKYSVDGDELWNRVLGFQAWGGLTADGTGVYVGGYLCISCTLSYLTKYSPDGAESWTSVLNGLQDYPVGVSTDATGVYLLSQKRNIIGGGQVRKWDARGNQLWTRELS